jgi:hypothetical protein
VFLCPFSISDGSTVHLGVIGGQLVQHYCTT